MRLSVITSRALPDVRDGLKPVQRRILYTMYHELQLYADRTHRQVRAHRRRRHGQVPPARHDAAYDALVRMAQDFVMRAPLVDGQGNFGSVDGDPPGRLPLHRGQAHADRRIPDGRAARSRPCRCGPPTTARCDEPVVLPAQFPNLLVNGTAGIAVGMATNIPPHNLGEVIRAATYLIENSDATTAQLLDRVKGPDFPLGGRIVTDRATLRQIYEEGQGSIKVQGEWKVEDAGQGPQDRHHVDSLWRQQGEPGAADRRHHRDRASCRSSPT